MIVLTSPGGGPLNAVGVCPNLHLLCSWNIRKKFFTKKTYFHILTRQLKQNLVLISKLDSKSSMKYQKVMIFVIEISRKWRGKFLKLCCKSWPKFEQVSKKSTDPSAVGTLSFRWIIQFLILLLFKKCSIKRAYSSKAKSSNVRDFLVAKNTVTLSYILNLVCVHT